MPRVSTADLDHILEGTPQVWDQLRDGRLFITGGTGFFGTWLLESLCWAVDRLHLPLETVVLTRSPESFAEKCPHLAGHPAMRFHQGDVQEFAFPDGRFTHVIHAAFPSTKPLADPRETATLILRGTERTLDFMEHSRAQHLLFTSSGAVYGRQPVDLAAVPETYPGAPNLSDPRSAYGESKRMAELLCHLQAQLGGLSVKVARGFAFVGPHLPLDAHFAIGNFIRDAMAGGPIHVRGDGTAVRSYLYAADLAAWLWTILVAGKSGQAYNVGGAEAVSIADLARRVRDELAPGVQINQDRAPQPGQIVDRYVPDVTLAASELGLLPRITLGDAVRRTADWARRCAPAASFQPTTVTSS
ncbi:MAG TPA: NAD(P)-dependent oxidoreductase [Planctomycetaceae bacterium]|nr:NAD(P)-dependent oxidoreductase [Planctomycetaceae bacterium]